MKSLSCTKTAAPKSYSAAATLWLVLVLAAVWPSLSLSQASPPGRSDNPPGERRGPPGTDEFNITSSDPQSESTRGEEHSKLLRAAQTIGPLGTALFGETVNLFTGSTEFRQTDVSIPGHVGPAMSVGRRFVMEDRKVYGSQYLFADWDIDLPYLGNVGPENAPWRVRTATPTARCSSPQNAGEAAPPNIGLFPAQDFWQGTHLNNAAGGGEILWSTLPSSQRPGPASAWKWSTKGSWFFSCLSTLKNAGSAPGLEGEGFLGVSPDGTRYWFDWMTQEQVAGIAQQSFDQTTGIQLLRRETRLYPTRIEDRFGNWVEYDWQGDRLLAIRAKDGRRIDLTYVQFDMGTAGGYDSGYRVSTVSDGLVTWRYRYDAFGRDLVGVDRPDGSSWTFDLLTVRGARMSYDARPECTHDFCTDQWPAWDQTLACSWMQKFDPTPASQRLTARMTHPSGAMGTFVFQPMRHGRSQVRTECLPPDAEGPSASNLYPVFSDVWAIISKQVSGPGLVTNTWQFAYPATSGGYVGSSAAQTRAVTITHPDGSRTENTFGTVFQVNEGQALSVRSISGATVLSQTDMAYASEAEAIAAPFAALVGDSAQFRGDPFSAAAQRPEKERTITQQGEAFVWRVSNPSADYDVFGNPTRVDRFSSLGFVRTDELSYHHSTSLWVLSQLQRVRELSTGLVEQQTDYDGGALPIRRWSFGRVIETFGYHPDGSLQSATDGNGNGVTLSGWFRGVPQTITFSDNKTRSAVVDGWGRITRTTDELGFSHTYQYDVMGRLTRIDYPSGWTPTTFSFAPAAVAEAGLPAGHWRQTETTGNFKKTTWFDARFRPVLTLEEDTGIGSSKRHTRRCFDHESRQTFAGYPLTGAGTVGCTGNGVRTVYDALGRVSSTSQSSEQGSLVTSTAYLPGFQTRTTDPNGNATTAQFQAFDSPDTGAPIVFEEPGAVTTTIVRDLFGKPLSTTRSGSHDGLPVTATRRYVYNGFQQLCKRIEPETGATLFAYDAGARLTATVQGSPELGLSCSPLPPASAITRSYDRRDRLLSVSHPGGPTTSYSYFADGALQQVSQGDAVWSYAYNNRRLLTSETLSFGDSYTFTYGYSGLGHLASVSTPSGLSIDYGPNALGQATRAGSFASGVSYFPDGSLKQFTYGNGITRAISQNTRLLPSKVKDSHSGGVVHEFDYTYDRNGNVTGISDIGQAGLQTRSLSYDTRNRLTGASASQLWGTAAYSYDPLDNLRSADQGSRQHRYQYDAQNRLSTITTPAGGMVWDFAYDAKGNETRRGSQVRRFDGANRITAIGNEAYAYDGHGRRVATWKADGSTQVEVYTQTGQLGFVVDSQKGGASSLITLAGLRIAEEHWQCATDSRTATYYHPDILGSPVAETDANRIATTRTHYAPYGEPLNRTVDGPGYTGHLMDASTGLVYAQQRYYDPVVGRFLSIDPVAADPDSGSNFNRYWYANNNPYKFTDPDGRIVETVFDVASLAIGVASFVSNVSEGNFGAAAVDAVGIVVDAGAAAIPVVPGGAGVAIKAARTADAARAANTARGRASEARKLAEVGATKNNAKVKTSTGDRIRDGTKPDGTHVEIKDTARLDNTAQLRGLDEAAGREGQTLEVFTGTNTKVSGNVNSNTLPNTTVTRCADLGPQC